MFTSVKLKQNLGKHLSTKYEVSMQTCSVSIEHISYVAVPILTVFLYLIFEVLKRNVNSIISS